MGLIKLLITIRDPKIPTLIYGFAVFIFQFLSPSSNLEQILIVTIIKTILVFVYFYLLNITYETKVWWIVLIFGVILIV